VGTTFLSSIKKNIGKKTEENRRLRGKRATGGEENLGTKKSSHGLQTYCLKKKENRKLNAMKLPRQWNKGEGTDKCEASVER